jgi:putative ATP-dependent endonuclease of OLD family
MDQHQAANGGVSIAASGVALIDCGGGEADRPFKRATTFDSLGYRVAVLRDDDKKPTPGTEGLFEILGRGWAGDRRDRDRR